jgi:hypothetical protein
MSTLIATAAVADLLRQAKELTEIRDPEGSILGVFAPASTVAVGDKQSTISTKQVFERLLSLTTDQKMRAYLQQKIQVLGERDACVSL